MNRVSLNCRGALRPAFAARTTTAATRRIISTYLSQYLSPVKAQEPRRIQKAKARDSPSGKLYPSDLYPGGRNVRTPYGVVKVFEWGPEDGEKVLFLHGIGTPSVGYGDLLREFVNKGYRVMTYGEFGSMGSPAETDWRQTTLGGATQTVLRIWCMMKGCTFRNCSSFSPRHRCHGLGTRHSTSWATPSVAAFPRHSPRIILICSAP